MASVITVSGYAEHGKTLTATMIKNEMENIGKRVVKIAFADYLKFVAEKYYGWNGKKDNAGRELLQQLGTNKVRRKYPDFWANVVANLVLAIEDDFEYVIVDDCRFPNEISCFSKLGIDVVSIRVNRTGYTNSLSEEQKNHPSETSLDNFELDYCFYAKDEKELLGEVKNFLTFYIR